MLVLGYLFILILILWFREGSYSLIVDLRSFSCRSRKNLSLFCYFSYVFAHQKLFKVLLEESLFQCCIKSFCKISYLNYFKDNFLLSYKSFLRQSVHLINEDLLCKNSGVDSFKSTLHCFFNGIGDILLTIWAVDFMR